MRRPGIPRPTPATTFAAFLVCGLLLTAGTACTPAPPTGQPRLSPDDVIRVATQRLTDDCLTRHGFTPPRPGRGEPPGAERTRVAEAMFGAGRTELSLRLPTGHVVRAHTDGCLAEAQRRLYGDQRRWFRTSTVVNNLAPEAAHTDRTLAEVRADRRTELAEWRRLRARALTEATSLISGTNPPPPKGNTAQ
ncbi:hypothetical protein [Streptomyces caniscabiei]|uniref:hypothetical protein n=1 Tax=Streptomyces caniscabiei TaxID=2746961 RepID=UPI0007661A9F|nr:hypothetical protein [Streptomyces caniscabiei]